MVDFAHSLIWCHLAIVIGGRWSKFGMVSVAVNFNETYWKRESSPCYFLLIAD